MNTHRHYSWLVLLAGAWLSAATAGLLAIADYDAKPCASAQPPLRWPLLNSWGEESLPRNSSQPTLLLFLHPKCPCSRASLSEVARLAHAEQGRVNIIVLFTQPANVADDWSHTDLWQQAVANRELLTVIDQAGLVTQQFGVQTSGQILLYDRHGNLQFDGGVTPGRGHTGESVGRFLLSAIIAGQTPAIPKRCATFGCPLSTSPQS